MNDNNSEKKKKTETGFSFCVRLARKIKRLFKFIHFVQRSIHVEFFAKGFKKNPVLMSHVHKMFPINWMALVTCRVTFFSLLVNVQMHLDHNQRQNYHQSLEIGFALITKNKIFLIKTKINQIHTALATNFANTKFGSNGDRNNWRYDKNPCDTVIPSN